MRSWLALRSAGGRSGEAWGQTPGRTPGCGRPGKPGRLRRSGRWFLMGPDTAGAPGEAPPDMGGVETGLARLIAAPDRAGDEAALTVPPRPISARLVTRREGD